MDIFSKVQVDFVKAILGGEVEIDTIHGPIVLTIPKGTQPGEIKRIPGRGIFNNRTGQKGNHYATLIVSLPKYSYFYMSNGVSTIIGNSLITK